MGLVIVVVQVVFIVLMPRRLKPRPLGPRQSNDVELKLLLFSDVVVVGEEYRLTENRIVTSRRRPLDVEVVIVAK